MSYDYEKYDGKRYVVDGEIIGLVAMEYGHEVETVFDEYHAEVALTPEQERQTEAYHENLRTTSCAQYKKVDELQAENAKLRELALMMFGCAKASECDECRKLNDGYACAHIMRELGIEVDG